MGCHTVTKDFIPPAAPPATIDCRGVTFDELDGSLTGYCKSGERKMATASPGHDRDLVALKLFHALRAMFPRG